MPTRSSKPVISMSALVGLISVAGIAQASVVIDATRVIYPSNRKEVSISLHNTGDAPSLVQAWIDTGDAQAKPGEAKSPFALTPPLFRLDPAKGQTFRLIYTQEPLATDRETMFWLNVLDIPPRAPSDPNAPNRLEMAFRHRLKILFRPQDLPGNAAGAAGAVTWSLVRHDGRAALTAHNPTPYFISYSSAEVTVAGIAGCMLAAAQTDIVPPFTTRQFALSQSDFRAAQQISVRYGFVNDYGAVVNGTASVTVAAD